MGTAAPGQGTAPRARESCAITGRHRELRNRRGDTARSAAITGEDEGIKEEGIWRGIMSAVGVWDGAGRYLAGAAVGVCGYRGCVRSASP